MTNIVICCDGTWNTPDQKDHGVPAPTNVVRILNAIAKADARGTRQEKYYHPGVGTDGSWWSKMVGGGTGRGLDRNIMSAYRWLCDAYAPGVGIYLFGFSRGAYTVRSLAGLISCVGLLNTAGLDDAVIWQRIEQAFQRGYRRKTENREAWDQLDWAFHNDRGMKIPIRFLGVWDTVGALGIPDDMALLNVFDSLHDYTFHDTNLSTSITTARHAIALDEMRASFQPTLWTSAHEDMKQVWFPGVHCDIGGGYAEAGLSDGALNWMIEEARKSGLEFNSAMTDQIKPDCRSMLHDSCNGAFALLPTQPRSIPQFNYRSLIHSSAIERQENPPIHQCPYRQRLEFHPQNPASLQIFAIERWNATGIWLDAGTTYRFEASGEWMDSSIKCGPGGCDDGNFQLGEVAQIAGTVLGKAEKPFQELTGNTSADFQFTRRHEDMEWFCLVGSIANGGGVDAKGHLEPHESFKIGTDCKYMPRKSGYFFAYANDAWNCYGNNRGSVRLTISIVT